MVHSRVLKFYRHIPHEKKKIVSCPSYVPVLIYVLLKTKFTILVCKTSRAEFFFFKYKYIFCIKNVFILIAIFIFGIGWLVEGIQPIQALQLMLTWAVFIYYQK